MPEQYGAETASKVRLNRLGNTLRGECIPEDYPIVVEILQNDYRIVYLNIFRQQG